MHYHLIGIGGAGMSAIAQILHEKGALVTGSDKQENDATMRLRSQGMMVAIGHDEANVDGAELVVYSAAIPQDNAELVAARRAGIQTVERSAMLGRIIDAYEHRIAVAGTHGKTTTTSMISSILEAAALGATTLVGGDLDWLGGNARLGQGSIAVTEACEAFGSFLHLNPTIAVITNIEADHMDYYHTMERLEAGFRRFVERVDPAGCVVACWDDERVRKVLDGCARRVVSFGLTDSPEISAADLDLASPRAAYILVRRGQALGEVKLGVPGAHNVVNSLAAAAAAFELGVSFDAVREGLARFTGVGRRFEILHDGRAIVVDDYAHHPAEIRATIAAARAAYRRRIVAVFQPHLYSRTKFFADEFAEALAQADEAVLVPIYAAREQPVEGATSEAIVDRMRARGFAAARFAPDLDRLADELADQVRPGEMVLVMGAGDVRRVAVRLASILSGRSPSR